MNKDDFERPWAGETNQQLRVVPLARVLSDSSGAREKPQNDIRRAADAACGFRGNYGTENLSHFRTKITKQRPRFLCSGVV